MKYHTKALYRLFRMNYEEDPSLPCEPWQVEDLNQVRSEEIFTRLEQFGVSLNVQRFRLYADSAETPEDLSEYICTKFQIHGAQDQVYLLLFELWRRYLPEKQSLSVFCDELDRRISKYDQGSFPSDEFIQDGLANLEEILDENSDIGADPAQIFASLTAYCAHDLESFLYDYIYEQIESGNESYALELLDGFYAYMSDLKWFDFLRACLISTRDIGEANEIIAHILLELEKEPSLVLQMEILRFMTRAGDRDLFNLLVKRTQPLLQTEEDFLELMEIVADFFRRLDQEEIEKSIQSLMQKRAHLEPRKSFTLRDPDVNAFNQLISIG